MRMIYHVIDRILPLIPDEPKYEDLKRDLRQVRELTLYKAPEQMPDHFRQVSVVLNAGLGEPVTDWQREIVEIFADRK